MSSTSAKRPRKQLQPPPIETSRKKPNQRFTRQPPSLSLRLLRESASFPRQASPIRIGPTASYFAVLSRTLPLTKHLLAPIPDSPKSADSSDDDSGTLSSENGLYESKSGVSSFSVQRDVVGSPRLVASVGLVTLLGAVMYGHLTAFACVACSIVIVSIVQAFENDSLQTQATCLGLAAAALIGATSTQRHDAAVLLTLSTILLTLVTLAPLTRGNLFGFAVLGGSFLAVATVLSGYLSGQQTAASVISISVPAWFSAVMGAIWSGGLSPDGLHHSVMSAVVLTCCSVLAGAFGASHDPPGIVELGA